MKKITGILASAIFLCVLAWQTPAQSVLRDGTIPEDLVITLSLGGTIQFSVHYTYRITADGKVYYDELQSLPVVRLPDNVLNMKIGSAKPTKAARTKPPKLADRLSKEQIKRMISAFESSGFVEMDDRNEGDKTLKEIMCLNHAEAKELSITANGKTKRVYFFLGCQYGERSPLKNFLSLYDQIRKELSGVKKIETKKRKITSID
jgi:hypothetical protein